jgi:hypothetical protein
MYLSLFPEHMHDFLIVWVFSYINPYLTLLLAHQKSQETSVTEPWYTIQHRPITHVRGLTGTLKFHTYFLNNGIKFQSLLFEDDK